MNCWRAMDARGGDCDRDTMKAQTLPVIPSRADNASPARTELPHSRTKSQHDRFRDARARRVEHLQHSLNNLRTLGGSLSVLRRIGMTRFQENEVNGCCN